MTLACTLHNHGLFARIKIVSIRFLFLSENHCGLETNNDGNLIEKGVSYRNY